MRFRPAHHHHHSRSSLSLSLSPRSYPHFEPHITLASGIPPSLSPGTLLTHCIPRTLHAPLHAPFLSLETGTVYTRSVYVAVHPTAELRALHAHVRGALGALGVGEPRSPCFPHMSLCYVDDADAGERGAVVEGLVGSGRAVAVAGGEGLALDCGGGGEEEEERWLSGFDGEEIWVVRCEGPVEQWEVLDKFSLRSS